MQEASNPVFFYVVIGLAIVGMLFLSWRNRKRQMESISFRDNLTAGQKVMTSSGLFGTVTNVDGDRVTLASASGAESEWLMAAIARLDEGPTQDSSTAQDSDGDTETSDTEGDTPPTDTTPDNPTR